MTEQEMAEIEARANAATEGPWKLFLSTDARPHSITISRRLGLLEVSHYVYDDPTGSLKRAQSANAAFIAHARQDIPALLAEVRRLRAINDKFVRLFNGEVVGFPTDWSEWRGMKADLPSDPL